MPCPYVIARRMNGDNPMYMIWHDDKFIQRNVFKMFGNFIPTFFNNQSPFIQFHLSILYFSKQPFLIPGTDGHKIHSRLSVIESFEANGMSMPPRPCEIFHRAPMTTTNSPFLTIGRGLACQAPTVVRMNSSCIFVSSRAMTMGRSGCDSNASPS